MQHKVIDAEDVVIRFAGDSGDGMQLTGTLFANTSAVFGNSLSTFPDYPAEIRAPKGTVSGVSGFQVHIGSRKVNTPGDYCDMLVAMNPAALKANAKWVSRTGLVLVNSDAFDEASLRKAGFSTDDPFAEAGVSDRNIIVAPITSHVFKKPNQPTHYLLENAGKLKTRSIVQLEQIKTIDKRRVTKYLGKIDGKDMAGIEGAILASLGFEIPAEMEAP